MVIIYDVGMILALLTGAAIGLLVTAGHYQQIALRHWAYEKEVAEHRELYAALGMLRHIKPAHAADDQETAA
jgi:hypothetical protein